MLFIYWGRSVSRTRKRTQHEVMGNIDAYGCFTTKVDRTSLPKERFRRDCDAEAFAFTGATKRIMPPWRVHYHGTVFPPTAIVRAMGELSLCREQ